MALKIFYFSFLILFCVFGYSLHTFSTVVSSVDCLNIPSDRVVQNGVIDPLIINPMDKTTSLRDLCLGVKNS